MDKGSTALGDVFRALPPDPQLVLFVWSNEAFAFAVRHVTQGKNPVQSAYGRWAITSVAGDAPKTRGLGGGLLLKLLLGHGPHWIIINMGYYATVDTVPELFTEAAITIQSVETKMVSCNTPQYALQQLRQWRGGLPPTVYWLPDLMPVDGTEALPEPTPPKPLGLGGLGNWWSSLLDGTRVSQAVVQDDFDPDLYFLPDIQVPSDDE
jgi:hypothetical protein